jgi:uncharacterized protein involved in response to NO
VGLVALWLIGRVAVVSANVLPLEVVALLDVSFLPVLGVVVGAPILRSGKKRNLSVVFVIFALALANGTTHLGITRADASLVRSGLYGTVYLVVFLILVIAGRVVPLFTRNALRRGGLDIAVQGNHRIGALALCAAGIALALDVANPGSTAGGIAALAAAPLLALRQWTWKPGYTLAFPMLWILHIGHGWIAIGFACHAAAVLAHALPLSAAIHAFTAGAMGAMILGMMTRVSLGHSGRPVEASIVTVTSFAAVVLGGVMRVFGSALAPLQVPSVFLISGAAFAAGYLLFVIEFSSLLWRARSE